MKEITKMGRLILILLLLAQVPPSSSGMTGLVIWNDIMTLLVSEISELYKVECGRAADFGHGHH